MNADKLAVDFAAIMADGLRSAAADGRTIQQPGRAARSALATKVPELCRTCDGIGWTPTGQVFGAEPCPDCPTIGKLLAIGAAVMAATEHSAGAFAVSGEVEMTDNDTAASAVGLLRFLRSVQP